VERWSREPRPAVDYALQRVGGERLTSRDPRMGKRTEKKVGGSGRPARKKEEVGCLRSGRGLVPCPRPAHKQPACQVAPPSSRASRGGSLPVFSRSTAGPGICRQGDSVAPIWRGGMSCWHEEPVEGRGARRGECPPLVTSASGRGGRSIQYARVDSCSPAEWDCGGRPKRLRSDPCVRKTRYGRNPRP
jgi:hypothetical protein